MRSFQPPRFLLEYTVRRELHFLAALSPGSWLGKEGEAWVVPCSRLRQSPVSTFQHPRPLWVGAGEPEGLDSAPLARTFETTCHLAFECGIPEILML